MVRLSKTPQLWSSCDHQRIIGRLLWVVWITRIIQQENYTVVSSKIILQSDFVCLYLDVFNLFVKVLMPHTKDRQPRSRLNMPVWGFPLYGLTISLSIYKQCLRIIYLYNSALLSCFWLKVPELYLEWTNNCWQLSVNVIRTHANTPERRTTWLPGRQWW